MSGARTLRRGLAAAARSARLAVSSNVPPNLILYVTSRCDATCPHCLYLEQIRDAQRKRDELSLDEFERIAEGYGPLAKLSIGGGEPFLRPDLPAIVGAFDARCRPAVIDVPTHGGRTDRVVDGVTEILDRTAANAPAVHVQVSIDGPPDVHDRLRGIPGLHARAMETARALARLRGRTPRLRLVANVTYLPENADVAGDLVADLERDGTFDRVQLTFPHGAVAARLSFDRYARLHAEILRRERPGDPTDSLGLLFRAARRRKDDVLRDAFAGGGLGAVCGAGRRIVVVDERGKVFPCEPLWEAVGDLRETDYRIAPILAGETYRRFADRRLGRGKCTCTWGCAASNAVVADPRAWPAVAAQAFALRRADRRTPAAAAPAWAGS